MRAPKFVPKIDIVTRSVRQRLRFQIKFEQRTHQTKCQSGKCTANGNTAFIFVCGRTIHCANVSKYGEFHEEIQLDFQTQEILLIYLILQPSDDIEASVPLISVQLDQPNLLVLKDTTECDQHISLFNLSVRLFDETIFAKTSQTFGDIVLDTHRGELDESGVTPSLFELKQTCQRNNAETKIVCEMRKPLQLRFAPKSIQKLLSLKDTISAIFKGGENLPQDAHMQPIVRYNKISEIKKLFGNATTVDFHMSKFIVDLMSSTNSLLSMCLYKLDSKVSVQDYPEQLTFNANLSSLAVNTDCSMVLHPTTLDFDLVLTQEKWNRRLSVAANFTGNIIDLQISPADIQTLAKIQVEFMTCMQQRNEGVNQTDEKTLEQPLVDRDNLIQVILPLAINRSAHAEDQFFQDDLR